MESVEELTKKLEAAKAAEKSKPHAAVSLIEAFGALAKAGMLILLICFSIWVLLVMHSCS
jgi:hypothetical protein